MNWRFVSVLIENSTMNATKNSRPTVKISHLRGGVLRNKLRTKKMAPIRNRMTRTGKMTSTVIATFVPDSCKHQSASGSTYLKAFRREFSRSTGRYKRRFKHEPPENFTLNPASTVFGMPSHLTATDQNKQIRLSHFREIRTHNRFTLFRKSPVEAEFQARYDRKKQFRKTFRMQRIPKISIILPPRVS